MIITGGLTITQGITFQPEVVIVLPNPYTVDYTIPAGSWSQEGPVNIEPNVTVTLQSGGTWNITQETYNLPNPYTANYSISGYKTQESTVNIEPNVTVTTTSSSTWGITP